MQRSKDTGCHEPSDGGPAMPGNFATGVPGSIAAVVRVGHKSDRTFFDCGAFSLGNAAQQCVKETNMKKLTLLAAALLLVSTASGYAAPKGSGNAGNAGGASEFSPGDQMRDSGGPTKGSRGASEFSPGDRMKDTTGRAGRGASEFSPGDRMNDTRKKQ
jgi:hypothetical protein